MIASSEHLAEHLDQHPDWDRWDTNEVPSWSDSTGNVIVVVDNATNSTTVGTDWFDWTGYPLPTPDEFAELAKLVSKIPSRLRPRPGDEIDWEAVRRWRQEQRRTSQEAFRRPPKKCGRGRPPAAKWGDTRKRFPKPRRREFRQRKRRR